MGIKDCTKILGSIFPDYDSMELEFLQGKTLINLNKQGKRVSGLTLNKNLFVLEGNTQLDYGKAYNNSIKGYKNDLLGAVNTVGEFANWEKTKIRFNRRSE